MPGYHCDRCDLAMPAQEGGRCPVCESTLVYNMGIVPAADWQEQVARLLGRGDTEEQVTRWRLARFLELGFEVEDAEALAARRDVDLHRTAGLIGAGCEPGLALRIVA